MPRLLARMASLLVVLVGRWQWQPPGWLVATGAQLARGWRFLLASRVRLAIAAAIVLTSTIAGAWYVTRPTPNYVTFEVALPGLTEYDERGVMSIKPLVVTFSESVAPLRLVQKP